MEMETPPRPLHNRPHSIRSVVEAVRSMPPAVGSHVIHRIISRHSQSTLFGLWIVLIALLLVPALDHFFVPGADAYLFMYIGEGILQGELPYVDRWDHKGPILFAIFAVMMLISPEWHGYFLVNVLLLLSIISVIFVTGYRLFNVPIALFMVAIMLDMISIAGLRGNPGYYALVFQVTAILIFIMSQKPTNNSKWWMLILGILGGLAFLIKPNFVAVWLAIGVCWLVTWRNSWRRIVWSGVGGISTLVIISLVLQAFGILPEAYDATITTNVIYSQDGYDLKRFLFVISRLFLGISPSYAVMMITSWVFLLCLYCTNRIGNHYLRSIVFFALVLTPIEIVMASISPRGYGHYYIGLTAVIALLLGFLVHHVLQMISVRSTMIIGIALMIIVVVHHMNIERYIDYTRHAIENRGDPGFRYNRHYGESQIVDLIVRYTNEDETIYIWGKGPFVHLASDRKSASRYSHNDIFFVDGYMSQVRFDEYVQEIRDNKPALIIDDNRGYGFPKLSWMGDHYWKSLNYRVLFDLVAEDYEYLSTVDSRDVYIRKRSDQD